MKRPPLRWLLLIPIVATLSIGGLALGIYVERSVELDLLGRVDDEILRVQAAARRPGGRSKQPSYRHPARRSGFGSD